MNVGYICRRHIVAIDSASTLTQAASLMREQHVGALVVTTNGPEGTQVTGLVTDRDLVIDVLARGLDTRGVQIGDLASRRLVSVTENEALSSAIETMQKSGVRRLLVTNDDLRLMGIVSLDDLLDACASELDGLAKVIRSGIERESGKAPKATSPPPSLHVPAVGTAGWGSASL
ncbi:MAG: CBS domain-containing protein [Rhizobacter sp.]|nr:CBS domain-containing protein [Rhizobacter sp.]